MAALGWRPMIRRNIESSPIDTHDLAFRQQFGAAYGEKYSIPETIVCAAAAACIYDCKRRRRIANKA